MARSRSKMGLTARVRVDGVENMLRELRRVTDRATAEGELMDALMKGGEPIRDSARRRAPVGTEAVSRRRLSDGIVVRKPNNLYRRGAEIKVAPLREVAHANLQEFGTRHHAAQPFMRPAFDEQKHRAVEIVRRELAAAIRRAL